MAGSENSPVVNPCFVIRGWDAKKVALRVDGETISRGPDLRWSVEKDAEGVCSLIVWLKKTAMKKVEFLMSSKS